MRDKKKLYLHIGRHKSGTTSIQDYLASAPQALQSYNILYPESSRVMTAHHKLAETFSRPNTRSPELSNAALNSATANEMRLEISNSDRDILVSSEGFQNTNPNLVYNFFSEFFSRDRTTVSVYIRNQIDYLASAYTQRVWATNYQHDMETFFESIFDPCYEKFLSEWCDMCAGNMVVRRFDREHLAHKDIVADFFIHTLNIDDRDSIENVLDRNVLDSNPSLTSEILAYKLLFNRIQNPHLDDEMKRLVLKTLEKISLKNKSTPVRATEALVEKCKNACRDSNKRVAERYFDESDLFDMDRPTGSVPKLSRDRVIEISDQLIEHDHRLENLLNSFNSNVLSCNQNEVFQQ